MKITNGKFARVPSQFDLCKSWESIFRWYEALKTQSYLPKANHGMYKKKKQKNPSKQQCPPKKLGFSPHYAISCASFF